MQCGLRAPAVLLRAPARALLPPGRLAAPIARAAGKQQQRRQQLSVADAPDVGGSSSSGQQPTPAPAAADADAAVQAQAPQGLPARVWRRVLRELSSLPRAIGIMAVITALSALGTVIPQNKALDYYMTNYPAEGERVLGFLDFRLLLGLQLDHIYSAWYFYGAIGLLAASLAACTYTTQLPTAKVAQRWRFAPTPAALRQRGAPQVLPSASLRDLGAGLAASSYQVFVQGGQLYAFKGLAGRLGPIGVHAALLMCIFGTAYSGFGGWKGSAMVPEGGQFLVADAISPASVLSSPPRGAQTVLTVNSFSIDTRADGSVSQFRSDLTLRDGASGQTLLRKGISVNDPLRYGGITMYQTDWSLAALSLHLQEPAAAAAGAGADGGAAPRARQLLGQLQAEAGQEAGDGGQAARPGLPQRSFTLPLASLEGRPGVPPGAKLWATFLPLELPPEDGRPPRGISMLARDLDTVTFYDSRGQFAGVRRAGSGKPIEVEGLGIVLEDVVGATGLEIKADPGVPLVYAGFGSLMVTTLISYVSHSQVWALQQGGDVIVAGRSNRSKVLFERELDGILDKVPELPQPAAAAGAAAGAEAAAAAAAKAGLGGQH